LQKKYFHDVSIPAHRGATIPYHYEGCSFNNIFLIGDAAGLCLKSTGEGISGALISGAEIGKKIIDPDYKTGYLDKYLQIKNRDRFWFTFFESLPRFRTQLLKFYFFIRKIRPIQRYFDG